MKVTALNEHLFQLTRLGFVNCYFVREDDGLTLVDTGMAGSEKQILAAAQQIGLPIVRIALTHAHADHVGSLDALHTALPEAQVIISERDARFLHGDMSLDPDEPQVPLRGGYPICQAKPALLLHEGDHVGSLEVIATPGHTPGHVAFLDNRDRALIAGDALQTLGGVAVAGTLKPFFPLPALATWHKASALESARKLLERQPSLLSVGHGRALTEPQAAMQHAIHEMEQALKKQARR